MKRTVSGIRSLLAAFFAIVFLQTEKAQADVLSLSPAAPALHSIIAQKSVGDCACGPCAIFNALQFSDAPLNHLAAALPGDTPDDKVRALIQRYGGKPSLVTPAEPRYLTHGGMWDADLVPFINDWLADNHAPPIIGERLTLQNRETAQHYLQRVYGELSHSLAAGFPPVINLQSFAARAGFFHRHWQWMDGHFVTVVAVQDHLPPEATQFSMQVADSQSGRILQVWVYAGPNQAATMPIASRAKRSGQSKDYGAEPYPYLMIQSPKLETILAGQTAKSCGVICVLQYIAHR